MANPNKKIVKTWPWNGPITYTRTIFDVLPIWDGHTGGVLCQENDLFTRFCSKLQNWIYQLNGKSVSQIFYMFDLTYSTKDSGKKVSKKVAGQHTFWLGRDLGRNGCRPWKWPKFKKFFSLDHGHYVACWLPIPKFLSAHPNSSTDTLCESAEKHLFQL